MKLFKTLTTVSGGRLEDWRSPLLYAQPLFLLGLTSTALWLACRKIDLRQPDITYIYYHMAKSDSIFYEYFLDIFLSFKPPRQ